MRTQAPTLEPLAAEVRGKDPFASPRWLRALRLDERLALGAPSSDDGAEPAFDADRASLRLEQWRALEPFDDDAIWRQRLALAGTDEAALRRLLGESDEALAGRCREQPPWLRTLAEAYGSAQPAPPFPWPEQANLERMPFVTLVEPLIQRAFDTLVKRARALVVRNPEAPFEAETAARALVGHLPDALAPSLNRALVVELHAARLEERLRGTTSEERFREFVDSLREPERAREILGLYPVLARLLVERIGFWRRAAELFLERLASDAGDIAAELFDGASLGRLTEARGDVSDPHRGGQSVLLLTFDSGRRLVYKPKPVAVEAAFQRLLTWLGGRGFEPDLRTIGVLDRGDHGWVEFVESDPCESADALSRFYRRHGGFVALLYVLDGTDFHHENLIAAGEHPVLVDLETLFQPWINGPSLDGVERHLGAELRSTVLRSDLLPERWWGDEENAGVDLSGLGSVSGQLTPRPVLAVAGRGTDEMRIERRRVEIPDSDNRPRVEGQEVSLLDHVDDLKAGYRQLYDLLLEHRQELLADDGPLAAFADVEVRILFRTTASYGALLFESLHPHLLGDAMLREIHFDRLWSAVGERPFLASLLPLELRELATGDVPLFLTRPGARDVCTWDGESLAEAFEDSGLDRVRRRIESLDPRDRVRQEAVLHDAFDVVRLSSGPVDRPSYRFTPRAEPAADDELLAMARRAGDRLVERAFEEAGRCGWMTIDYQPPAGWCQAPAGPDVYAGLPGIAFALGYLGDLFDETRFTIAARGALAGAAQQVELRPELVEGIGGFNGWGGLIYTLTHLGVLWDDSELLDQAEALAARMPAMVAEDELLDVVAGSAGCLLCLLPLADHRPSASLEQLLVACGERLLAKAEPQERGWGWPMPLAGNLALAGISHGAAGIVLALLRLWARTGDDRYREGARHGLDFERSLFAVDEGNWPDLRAGHPEDLDSAASGSEGGQHFMHAWCHGAPGIGLARVAGLPILDDEMVHREIEVAVETTRVQGFGDNHSLCHGDLGNLELLLEAARAGGDAELHDEVYRRAGGILDGIERHGWLFGLPGNIETPGLMCGLAGVAYGLARLAAPERLPAVLTLAPTILTQQSSGRSEAIVYPTSERRTA